MNATNQNLTATMRGDYLSPEANPWLDQTFDKGVEQIKATLSPKFGHMQAFGGSSGYNEALGRSTSDLASNIYGGNYQAERERQVKGMALAPQIAGQDYADAQALTGSTNVLLERGLLDQVQRVARALGVKEPSTIAEADVALAAARDVVERGGGGLAALGRLVPLG